YAFANCPNLSEVVDMPSIGTMHHYAFAGTALTSVDISGLHMSGNNVFANCTKLTEVITGKFTAIGNNMFRGCTELRYSKENPLILHTPKIGDGAFNGCSNLAGVRLENPEGEDLEFAIGASAFSGCTNEGFFVDMSGVKVRSIGDRAFANSAITTFTFPNGLESLGSNVFANTAIDTIVISEGVDFATIRFSGIPFQNVMIKNESSAYELVDGVLYNKAMTKVFHVNPSVTELLLPASVTEIGDYALAGSNVRTVTLTANVEKIGVGAFMNSAVSAINLKDAAITEIPANAFSGAEYIRAIELSDNVTKIGANAFANSGVNSFKANGLTAIADGAFANCRLLKGIALADGIESIGSRVFENCIALEEATMPSVKELGDFTFYGARSLKKVIFGNNATTIGKLTFFSTNVTEVELPDALTVIDTAAFFGCKQLATIDLKNVTVIEDGAFGGCSKLTTVKGLDKVEKIGDYAFYGCGMPALNLASATSIGEMAFASTGMNVTIYQTEDGYQVTAFGDSQLPGYLEYTYNYLGNFVYSKETASMAYQTVSIPKAVTIGRFAFFNGGETEIELPASLENLGYGAFAASKKLSTIKVQDGNG
ncbi:MAG: leucine-rich repeat protein, partial [Clostridia bacterium]|nr:leucine-rich repeat protein [Clostridia bacterium]